MYDEPSELIAIYRAMPVTLAALARQLDDAGAAVRRSGTDWSVSEIVCHLLDGEQRTYERVIRIRDENRPMLSLYPDDEYRGRSLAHALASFSTLRVEHARLLDDLDAPAWARTGIHEAEGELSILDMTRHTVARDAEHRPDREAAGPRCPDYCSMSPRKETIEVDGPNESTVTRVVSRDGTEIGYWTTGGGPPLVLVHGGPADHTRWEPLLPYLEPHATVHAIDRRGRGDSGDAPNYKLAREYEDVAAVVDAAAEASGSTVDLYGHSFGGWCAFGAATLTSNIHKLVLYEGWPAVEPDAFAYPPGLGERLDAFLAEGNREAALETYFREFVMMPEEAFNAFRALPSWQARLAAAHTITREDRAIVTEPFNPEQAAKITVPTLLLTGSESPDLLRNNIETVAGALPDARILVIERQQHVADVLVPQVFAERVLAFLRQEQPA